MGGSGDWPEWSGEAVVLVASGVSASDAPLHRARGRAKCIAINSSWRLAPWADVLYACDAKWWRANEGAPEFEGLRVGFEPVPEYPDVRRIEVDKKSDVLVMQPGTTGSGGNSGFQALNLAVQWGARRVLLVGYDMRIDLGAHWHGRHGAGLNNPTDQLVKRWVAAMDGAAATLAALGVEVLNCSPISALTAYRKTTLEEAL